MAQRVECPGCGAFLVVPAQGHSGSFTCPHCLASVPPPTASQGATQLSAEGIQAAPAATAIVAEPGANICHYCGEQLEERWRCCPSCGRPRRGSWVGPSGMDLDVDMRRDQKRTSGCLIALAVIGGIGILYGLGISLSAGPDSDVICTGFILFLLILVAISAVRVYTRPQRPTGAQGIRRVLFGTLALAGAVLGSLILLAVAVGLFAFIVCLGTSRHF